MPRNMSFSLTTEQVRNRTKTVTRRKGWKFLKAGDIVNACVKCMGLKPGEQIERICQIRIVSVLRQPLRDICLEGIMGTILEGFPNRHPNDFVEMFCEHMGGSPDQEVTRIAFEYLEDSDAN